MSWKNKLTPDKVDRLTRFARLIHQWNSRINLTGYKSVDEIEALLIGESVFGLQALPVSGAVLDFGSGAGIPGLVWAICDPALQVTSLEIREKKFAFQKEAQRQFQIPAEIIRGKFPETVSDRKFSWVVSRAIRLEPSAWESAKASLAPVGRIVRFAGAGAVEEGWQSVPASARTTLLVTP